MSFYLVGHGFVLVVSELCVCVCILVTDTHSVRVLQGFIFTGSVQFAEVCFLC